MLQTLKNAWKIEELRKKILFTILIILLYRLGNAVPVPFVNVTALQYYFQQLQNTVLGLYNVMSGGAFSTATIFALSIQPYINASIIIQLLCIAIPALERMSKEEGEEGRKKIASITRYATVGIGLLMGFAYYMLMRNNGLLAAGTEKNIWVAIVVILTFTSGSALIMWLGEQITEFGIGNGISMILFASIVSGGGSGLPRRPGPDRPDRVCQRCRAPHPGPVRQARRRPENVRRPEHLPPDEGQHVRRYAHHLRTEHRNAPRDDRGHDRREVRRLVYEAV